MKFGILFFIIIAVLVGTAVFSPSARAELVTVLINGTVDRVTNAFGILPEEIVPGVKITGKYVFDSDPMYLHPDGKVGRYNLAPPGGIEITIAGEIFSSTATARSFLQINDFYPLDFDGYFLDSRDLTSPGVLSYQRIYWNLSDSGGTAQPSNVFPKIAPNVEDWDHNVFGIFSSESDGRPYGQNFTVEGHIDSAVVVPEPVTILLLGFGALVLGKRRKRE